MLVATIGVAQLMLAITLTLPEYRTGSLSGAYPIPIKTEWHLPGDVILEPGQIMALIIVPLVTLGLWWLLGHTSFGESVRGIGRNPDLARLTGINPEADLHRGVGDRRVPVGAGGDPDRDRVDVVRPRVGGTQDAVTSASPPRSPAE